MFIEQIYTSCLAEASYYIESEGEAAVIDPIRETDPYVRKATERNATIKYVFETHFHADFVSGHIDLANQTGSSIVFGPTATPEYEVIRATDGQEFSIGKVKIRVLHTPGHTPESTTYLLIDEHGKEHAIFTGDTLFVGDVGRPDLLDGVMTKEELAGMLYDSLNNKIKPLADEVIVYPGHGPGSACGKNIGTDTWSTVGTQKKSNYALQPMTKAEFIAVVTDGLTDPPKYFFVDASINKKGYESIDSVMGKNVNALSASAFRAKIDAGATVLDTRSPVEFAAGYIHGSVQTGLEGSFAVWVGTILDPAQELLVVAPAGRERETILRLARVGFEKVAGYLDGGISAWTASGESTERIENLSAADFFARSQASHITILDVRKPSEYAAGHLSDAKNLELATLEKHIGDVPAGEPLYIHCAGGYRSMIAASILRRKGFHKLVNIEGGFAKIRETGAIIVTDSQTV